jgi:hydroxymethylpyrimidine/phosphomethylpyrimidine kinase
MRKAARELHRRFGCATLIKGGHLPNATVATDIFFDGKKELRLTSPFIPGLRLHGTGCTYSAAITAHLALGASLPQAVMRAKRYITHAILHRQTAGEHTVLNHFH